MPLGRKGKAMAKPRYERAQKAKMESVQFRAGPRQGKGRARAMQSLGWQGRSAIWINL